MIAFVKGTVFSIEEGAVIIDTGAIGVKVYMSPRNLSQMTKGEEITIHTYLRVAEDLFDLYGFLSDDELLMFKKIISVSGAGPKAGLSVLSALTPSEFALALATDNYKAITKAQGIGPKLAQKMVLELKDKIGALDSSEDIEIKAVGNATASSNSKDAIEALVGFGYTKSEASLAVGKLDQSLPTDQLIKLALKSLAGGFN